MSKKLIALLLAMLMVVTVFAGCRGGDDAPADVPADAPAGDAPVADAPVAPETENSKVGILTGTVSQGEEEYQAAVKMKNLYGDRIVTATYPDNFTQETETLISNAVSMASDPEVKAIVFLQAVPGAGAAIDKVRETRPDMLFIAGVPAEPPADITGKADIVINVDDLSMGARIAQQAVAQGAETLIHYSFPRHLSYETIAARRSLMMAECEKLGIKFVDVTAPDPTSDAGVAGAQQFILEDVPRQVAEYGKNTAFFSTNCSMQEPLIRAILEEGAVFPQQCCPSPYHGYPGALNIDVAGNEGDVAYMLDQITLKVEEGGNGGRMSTWPAPVNMIMVEASTLYALDYADGKTDGRVDDAALRAKIAQVSAEYGAETDISTYADDSASYDNFYLLLSDFYNFGEIK